MQVNLSGYKQHLNIFLVFFFSSLCSQENYFYDICTIGNSRENYIFTGSLK